MKTITCEAELLPDGHLVLPPEVIKQIKTRSKKKPTKRRIIILTDEPRLHHLSRFCGKWQDERDADEIIAEIRADREKNVRSEKVCL
ncbi:MAG: hypothetical protein KAW12_24130 [Candidatus Aminicenantes bacterium]|nr:hypothetical protein [Candidatus Aminicenantes bacterium]